LRVQCNQVGGGSIFQATSLAFIGFAQQSVHWICGILRLFSSIFLASSFFCSQAFSTPAHKPVTQTVGRMKAEMLVLNFSGKNGKG
jgi:hypothetical protein